MMRIWNPSHFQIGESGRSNCPKWRGQDYSFNPNETKEVPDLCGRWLITQFGYYGLVSLPDRNIVTDKKEYIKAVETMRTFGIQQIYKWSVRVVDQYRDEAKKCIDSRERPPRPNNFVKLASKIQKKYKQQIILTDPATIEEHNLMREILGTVEHDSDKMLDRSLAKELKDADENARQYSRDDMVIEDEDPQMPGEPTKAKPISEVRRVGLTRDTRKKPRKVAAKQAATADSTMENMKVPLDLDNQNAL